MLDIPNAALAAGLMALVIVFCRALPFLFFSGKKPPVFLDFINLYMPAVAMTVLAVSSYTKLEWGVPLRIVPALTAGALVVLLHLWKRNSLLSIIGGTVFYIVAKGFLGA